MHKKLFNEATFSIILSVQGPLLVKSGIEGWDPTIPDMQFVRTRHHTLGDTIFIPGSSLKGPIRAYTEKIANTLGVTCCDLFDKDQNCGSHPDIKRCIEQNDSAGIYKNS